MGVNIWITHKEEIYILTIIFFNRFVLSDLHFPVFVQTESNYTPCIKLRNQTANINEKTVVYKNVYIFTPPQISSQFIHTNPTVLHINIAKCLVEDIML